MTGTTTEPATAAKAAETATAARTAVADGLERSTRRWVPVLRAAAVASVPVVLALLAQRVWLHASVSDYLPIQTDELSYWHQISTFAKVGFGNGYYSYQEQTPPVMSAYGAWGPIFPMLYGSVLALIGVSTTSVVWLNIVAFLGLTTAGLVIARPSQRRTLLLAVVLATFTPALLYVPSGMEEPVHLALAVLLAALFHRVLIAGPEIRLARAAWLTGVITLSALLRPTWGLLLIPAALVATRESSRRRRLWTLTSAVGGAGAFGVLFSIWSAPYPYLGFGHIRRASTVGAKLDLVEQNIRTNLRLMLPLHDRVLQTGVSQRYQLMVVVAVLAGFVGWSWFRRNVGRIAVVAGIAALALVLPFGLVMVFYDIAPGTRVIGAHLLFVVVLLALSRPRWLLVLPALVIASNLATITWFHQDFVARNGINVRGEPATIEAFREAVAGQLRYRPGADRWCNTVLAATEYGFFYQLIGVPPGIGVGIDLNHDFQGPLRSGYVITTSIMIVHLPGQGRGLVPIVHTERGTLYRNLNSSCYGTPGRP